MLDDTTKSNLTVKLSQADYFLQQMKKDESRPNINYNASAFANTIYTVCAYVNSISHAKYAQLCTISVLQPFILDGANGGIRGLDVHKSPLKTKKHYFVGPNAKRDGMHIELSELDSIPIIEINGQKQSLFVLCSIALAALRVEIITLMTGELIK